MKVKVTQSCLSLCDPMDYTVHGILQARILEWVAFPFSTGTSQPGIKPRSPALQAVSLPSELQGKPKNIGVGSLSLPQQIFPVQESNRGPLHCRQILYQQSYCLFKVYWKKLSIYTIQVLGIFCYLYLLSVAIYYSIVSDVFLKNIISNIL